MTYEYICTGCGHQWEADQSIKDAPLKTCPNCNEQTAKRQVSGGTGFVLKGGGWYADLYGSSKPSSKAETASSSDSSDGASKSESKAKPSEGSASESKSETKSSTSETKPSTSKASSSSD
ncbi:MAG TPA: zinc ribbon domain-containing protein [Polyangiaceae bacterium]|nr:zinc ribbon domain-containing protein [Polyangiaceae bacterium]